MGCTASISTQDDRNPDDKGKVELVINSSSGSPPAGPGSTGKGGLKSTPTQHTNNAPISRFRQEPEGLWKQESEGEVRFASGFASASETPALTILQAFQKTVEMHGAAPHLRQEVSESGELPVALLPLKKWQSWTFRQSFDKSVLAGKAFVALGAAQHSGVGIYGNNCPEWFWLCLGAMIAGFKATPFHLTDNPDPVVYRAQHSGCAIVCVSNTAEAYVFVDRIEQLPDLMAVVVWGKISTIMDEKKSVEKTYAQHGTSGKVLFEVPLTRLDGSEVHILTMEGLLDLGRKLEENVWTERLSRIAPGHCCGLAYSSGTAGTADNTGTPKAVMLSHDNFVFTAAATMRELSKADLPEEPRSLVSYLPLTQVFVLLFDMIIPVAALSLQPWTVHFVRSYDITDAIFFQTLKVVQPVVFFGVPHVWETLQSDLNKTLQGNSEIGNLLQKLSSWAHRHPKDGSEASIPSGQQLPKKSGKYVRSKLGFNKVKVALAGGAAVLVHTLEYFHSIGITIHEMYGLPETTGVHCMSMQHLLGSCGSPLDGCEMKIVQVNEDSEPTNKECPPTRDIMHPNELQQGELCMRGRNLMMGYMAQPTFGEEHVEEVKEASRKALATGWLHSGDKATQTNQKICRITGRFKEIMVSAQGERIAPGRIEDTFRILGKALSRVVVIGNQRPFNIALVTLKADGATGKLPGGDRLTGDALHVNKNVTTVSAACQDEVWIKYITDIMHQVNKTAPNDASKIKLATILPTDLSIKTGELTASYKVKRPAILQKHAMLLNILYDAGSGVEYMSYSECRKKIAQIMKDGMKDVNSNNFAASPTQRTLNMVAQSAKALNVNSPHSIHSQKTGLNVNAHTPYYINSSHNPYANSFPAHKRNNSEKNLNAPT